MHRKIWYDDDTQHNDEDLSDLDTVQSRIRISMTAPKLGTQYPTVNAWHMDFTSISVLQVALDERNNSYSVVLGKGGPHITWFPVKEGNPEWQLTPDHDSGYEIDDIYASPISDVQFPVVETYPEAEQVHWRDFVLVFPLGSGIPPVYIVYWEHQPRGEDGRWQTSDTSKPAVQRPSLRAETKRKIEAEQDKDIHGRFVDDEGNVIEKWHYGHKTGLENRRILRAADELGMTQAELNDFVNSHPDYFQIEEAQRNLTHVDEKPGYGDLDDILDDMAEFLEGRK
nr:S-type pyocin domain-containing protein [Photobacterium halotolerans]